MPYLWNKTKSGHLFQQKTKLTARSTALTRPLAFAEMVKRVSLLGAPRDRPPIPVA